MLKTVAAWLAFVSTVALLSGTASSAESARASKLSRAAVELLSSLSKEERSGVQFELEDDVRATWSNLPTLMAPPAGVFIKDLSDSQRLQVHSLLRASLSSQGYGKTVGIMWLDDVLYELETAQLAADAAFRENPLRVAMAGNRSSGNYAIAVFGNPETARWGWKITGHHLALNVTVVDDQIGFLPMFIGSNPRVVNGGPYAGWMALPAEGDVGLSLLGSLDGAQLEAALVSVEVPADVFAGPGRRDSIKAFEGVSAKSFTAEQMSLLQRLVAEYVTNANHLSSGEQLDAIAAVGWDKLWFSWRGAQTADDGFYYRVHGPRILIEYGRQDQNHDHAVVRDPLNDYGEDWLGHHYREFHPPMDKVMADVQRRISADD